MKILKGRTASTGIVMGLACLYSEKFEEEVPHYIIGQDQVDNEILRLNEALKKAKDTMKEMIVSAEKLFDKSASEIFNTHVMVLDDPVLYEKMVGLIRDKLVNAEHAASDAFEEYINNYESSGLHFAEFSHDIKDVRNRIISSFSGISGHFECPVGERQSVIVVSKRLTPSVVLNIPREHVLAFVTEEGGFTTHATILARGYGVPVIFGVAIEHNISCADRLIVDGSKGKVYVNPDESTASHYENKIKEVSYRKNICDLKIQEAPRTKKGLRIQLKANISVPGELGLLKDVNHDGVGLLRTEFLFVNKTVPPSEDEQFNMYKHILEEIQDRPVTIRLLDIGADKIPVYLHLPPQDNPDLGIRGARALEFFHDLFLTQVKAIIRASNYGDIRILYPMVADISDIHSFKQLSAEAKSILKKQNIRYKKSIKEGIMIETPAAALMSKSLLKYVDFANIGSNDLLQYTLAASRGNTSVENRYHILHPALVKLIEIIVKAGNYHKKEICLCGEIAGFEEFYPLFLNLGLRSFSVTVSKVSDIKCELLHHSRLKKDIMRKFYQTTTKDEIDKIFLDK